MKTKVQTRLIPGGKRKKSQATISQMNNLFSFASPPIFLSENENDKKLK